MEQKITGLPEPFNSMPLNCPQILLMPTKHMGNLLVSLHSIIALAQNNRSKSLVVVDEAYREIIESIPAIDDVLYYPRRQLRKASALGKLVLLKTFYDSLRNYQAKLLLNFDSQRLSTIIALTSGIKVLWGLSHSPCRGLYKYIIDDNEEHPHRFYHYHQYTHRLLDKPRQDKPSKDSPRQDTSSKNKPGKDSPGLEEPCQNNPCSPQYPGLLAQDKHRKSLGRILQARGFDSNRPYICMHGGATKDYKRWPEENFSQTADWLSTLGYQVIFVGAGKSDRLIIEQINALCAMPHIDLCDALSLGELIALFNQCELFIGNDSGPMHLAAATGVATFALFGPTDEQRWGPLGANATVIRDPLACTDVCSKKSCPEDFRCIKLLSGDVVRNTLSEHMSKPSKKPAVITT